MSVRIKSGNVEKWAGAWLRIDGALKETLAFDNMQERPILANKNWQEYEIVVDVPSNSIELLFGVLLVGNGQIWVDDFNFEVVNQNTKLTSKKVENPYVKKPKTKPINNGF